MQAPHRIAHRWIWTVMAVALPLFLAYALTRPIAGLKPPVRLSPPMEKGQP